MSHIAFTIYGNQKNHKGNPIPYTRSTQAGQWKPNVVKYREWKEYVRGAFLAECVDRGLINHKDFKDLLYILPGGNPIKFDGRKAIMNIVIYFMDDTHADCDNVFKGIADALFVNDKYLAGSFDFAYAHSGRVDVVIHFTNEMGKPVKR